jgi:glycosyltransferase involved in cell wall biosynthesis
MLKQKKTISIVTPAFNEIDCLGELLSRFENLAKIETAYNFEVIVVENGSTDRTLEILKKLSRKSTSKYRVISSPAGLGSALRAGIRNSSGETVAFMADDLPFGFQELEIFTKYKIDLGAGVFVFTSKYLPTSEYQTTKSRKVLGLIFMKLRKILIPLTVNDTQGSFVANGNYMRKIASDCVENGFLITTEILMKAHKVGIKVIEEPCKQKVIVERKSTIRPHSILSMFRELINLAKRNKTS